MNIYEDCVPCELCGHPFLPFKDERICDECKGFDEIRDEEAEPDTGPTNGSKNWLGENQD